MLKKLVLILTVFGLACVAYMGYTWQDTTPLPARQKDTAQGPSRNILATQPTTQAATFQFRGAEIQPGDGIVFRAFGPDGRVRSVFQAPKFWPVSDTELQVTQPSARVLLPGGQLAYVRADEGHVVVQRDEKSNFSPKRGKLTGHVQLFIDRSRPEERLENPENAEPEDRPEAVTKIWMDDLSFDLDLARLETDGNVKVQSVDATIEGRGLTLIWNESNRRIKLLRINQGKRAVVHMSSLVQLGIARDEQGGVATGELQEPTFGMPADGFSGLSPTALPPTPAALPKPAPEAKPVKPPVTRTHSITLSDLEDIEEPVKADRVDTYQIVFKDGIVAEQRQGIRVVGRLKADVLEILRDFGSEERAAVEHAPAKNSDAAVGPVQKPKDAAKQSDGLFGGTAAKKDSTLELQWRGELVVTPLASTEDSPEVGNRFQVIAEGNPVELHDRETGDATCRRLEYRDQTQEVWLIGNPNELVTLQADARRRLSGERVFVDRKNGLARVEGAGHMTEVKVDDEEKDWPECIKNELAKQARQAGRSWSAKPENESEEVEVTWRGGVEVRFSVDEKAQPSGSGPQTRSLAGGKEVLKSAHFHGGVTFNQPGQSMSADHIDVYFADAPSAPAADQAAGERNVIAERILASGNVRMSNDQSVIACDRLEVDMTTDDLGRNVPRIGRAYGKIVARQGSQEIRAADQMLVALESVPKPIAPQERERLEAAATACGYTPESEEWKAVQAKIESRREVIVRTLNARGDVLVLDPKEEVDVGADVLDCSFDDAQQIAAAVVMGRKDAPAHVAMSDFYMRGAQINFRLSDQTAEVPGEGILRFFTKQDLSGRRVDQPVPVVITWKNGMTFRGSSNTGLFSGSVRAVSEGTILDCRELSLRFENLPEEKPAAGTARQGPDPRWITGRVIDLLTEREERKSENSAAGFSKDMRKRLTHIHAIGDAVIASSEYEKPKQQFGPFSGIMAGIMPEAVQTKPPAREDQRLLSFVRISGPRITTDLNNEHLVVEGAGNLLVLDYRLPAARPGRSQVSGSGSTPAGSAMVGSLQSGGPSQTVFTWQNSMSYLNRRNVAVLDNRVVMKHAAGAEMAMPEQIAAAMKVDISTLTGLKSRRAELTCENLVVEFERNRERASGEQSSLSAATELKSFQASHRVRMQENNRSVEGELVTYDSGTGLVRIQGSPQLPARIADIDEKTGAVPGSWRGQELEWDLNSGVIKVRGASIVAPGR